MLVFFFTAEGVARSAYVQIPIRSRRNQPTTYPAPLARKNLNVKLPKVTSGDYKPEPALSEDDNDHILKVIHDMVLVMERSPKAFHALDEEGLRSHILVQLNGHFEGGATGETFNCEGKTDILVRYEGKNIFIAECKIWDGQEEMRKAIDQLFRYATWRDTKLALILFSRRKDFSAVIQRIPGVVESHPCCVKRLAIEDETRFQYLFHQPKDPNRQALLTVMAFDVPRPE